MTASGAKYKQYTIMLFLGSPIHENSCLLAPQGAPPDPRASTGPTSKCSVRAQPRLKQSQSLFYFIPQENLTAKQDWLAQPRLQQSI